MLAGDRRMREEEAKRVAIELAKGTFPTPVAVVEALNMLGPSMRPVAIRAHKFWKERKIRTGFSALVAALHDAHLGFAQAEMALTSYAGRREDYAQHVAHTVRNPAQKELLAFTAAMQGLHDTVKEHLMVARRDIAGPLRGALNAFTKAEVYPFMKCLRNNLLHGQVSVPSTVVTRASGGIWGAIKFDADELLAFGDWREPAATRYLQARAKDGVVLSDSMRECVEAAKQFDKTVSDLLRVHATEAEADYYAIEDGYRRRGAAISYKIFLSSFAKGGGDGYAHLHRFFDDHEVREILRRPRNSVEQVEFMISLRAADVECDTDLRYMLYEIFGVTDAPKRPEAKTEIKAFSAFRTEQSD